MATPSSQLPQPPLHPAATPSKRQSLFDTIIHFGRPNYAPLTPIEILPGIMSTDGVAAVFQLDTRKPKTHKQKTRAALVTQQTNGQDVSRKLEEVGYFDTAARRMSTGTVTGAEKASIKKSFIRALVDDGRDDFSYERAVQASKKKKKDKKGDILLQNKGGVSPTDKLTVRHANPFTGVLSRNQTELNISKYMTEAASTGNAVDGGKGNKTRIRGSSPPYPHGSPERGYARDYYKHYSTVSTPNLMPTAFEEDLVPMPSVHEPAPFSFPGATAEEIDAYERALGIAARNVASNMSMPPSRVHSTTHHENSNGGTRVAGQEQTRTQSKADSFLGLDGGLEEQQDHEQQRTGRILHPRLNHRQSSLQDRHLHQPNAPQPSPPPQPPHPLLRAFTIPPAAQRHHYRSRSGQTLNSLQEETLPTSSPPEQPISTSTSTMAKGTATTGGSTATLLGPPPPSSRTRKKSKPAPPAAVTGIGKSPISPTVLAGEIRFPKKGPALKFFDTMPFVDPRGLAEYRRARAGLPPLRAREGWVSPAAGIFPPSTPTGSEEGGRRTPPEDDEFVIVPTISIKSSSSSLSSSSTKSRKSNPPPSPPPPSSDSPPPSPSPSPTPTTTEEPPSPPPPTDPQPSLQSILTSLLFPPAPTAPPPPLLPESLSIPLPTIPPLLTHILSSLSPLVTGKIPRQFFELPTVVQVLVGCWYVLFVTWVVVVLARCVGVVVWCLGVLGGVGKGVGWVWWVVWGG
ncbi:hypothetical protein DFH27DRAFT_528669 [Peziza echinospora]|nr:hypothetical protein DFH27DRAFT_528669 [Peziza echinospora]